MLKKVLNQKGMAAIEIVPVLLMFVLLLNFTLGFFGVIHSGILASIGARNYAFETFRNRANLNYIRDESKDDSVSYNLVGLRYHAVVGETARDNAWIPSQRFIKFTDLTNFDGIAASDTDHNQKVRSMANEKEATSKIFTGVTKDDGNFGVSPVWIMTVYGICLNSECKKL